MKQLLKKASEVQLLKAAIGVCLFSAVASHTFGAGLPLPPTSHTQLLLRRPAAVLVASAANLAAGRSGFARGATPSAEADVPRRYETTI